MNEFAILKLKDLNTTKFDHKDEWKDAMGNLNARDVAFLALRWDHLLKRYVNKEIVE